MTRVRPTPNAEALLPPVAPGDDVAVARIEPQGHTTSPPARYTEASLIKRLEELGIGRPSTWASIIQTIQDRGYVWKKGQALVPTWTAFAVVGLMEQHFDDLVDYEFTARVETDLDAIAAGECQKDQWLRSFYFGDDVLPGLKRLVEENLDEIDAAVINTFLIGVDGNGDDVVVKPGRYGPYVKRGEDTASVPDDLPPDELTLDKAVELLAVPKSDEPIGDLDGHPVFAKNGRYGPYVQWGTPDDLPPGYDKPKMSSLFKTMTLERLTIEDAKALLSLPRNLGTDPADGVEIVANNGRYGPYVQKNRDFRSLDNEDQLFSVTLDEALAIFAQPKTYRRGNQNLAAKGPLREFGTDPASERPVVAKRRPVRPLRHRRRDERLARPWRPSRGHDSGTGLRVAGGTARSARRQGWRGDETGDSLAGQEGRGPQEGARPASGDRTAAVHRSRRSRRVGKSTQAQRLAVALDAVLTRETGGTDVGARLRAILHDVDVVDLEDRAEALITAADRAQHVARVVRPALEAGRPVVSDRTVYSTLAYQGYGRGLDLTELRSLNDWAIGGLWPTRVVLLEAPVDVLAARLRGRELDRFERAGADVPPARRRRLSGDGRGRPRPLGRRRRRRRSRRGGPAGARPGRGEGLRVSGLWVTVVGQDEAVERLRRAATRPVHAYLLVGPPGSTKDEAARAFAAELLSGHDPGDRDARLALAGAHPDIREVLRTGPAISVEQAREVVRLAALAPVEGSRKVLILHELHLLRPEGAALLLKTIEEPPESTYFVALADFIPPELVTIASRCVRVDFRAIPDDLLMDRLVAEGTDVDVARAAATSARGDLSRARILAVDPDLASRRTAFAALPDRLDGTGAVVIEVAAELLELIEQAAGPLAARHAAEASELDARIELLGQAGQRAQAARRTPPAGAAASPHRRAPQWAGRARRRVP